MISGGMKFILLVRIRLITEAKFAEDPLLLFVTLRVYD